MRTRLLASVCYTVLTAVTAFSQWSTDPNVDNIVYNGLGDQVTPKIASTSDGGVYVGWFDNRAGNYDMRLQRYDAAGFPQFDPNGLLISDKAQNSSLVEWDLIADSSDNAVLVFTDLRNGVDLDVQAYRISPAGAFLWGADGVGISNNSEYEPAPSVAELSDGRFIVIWAWLPSSGTGAIRGQLLDPNGRKNYAADGDDLITPSVANERPAFSQVVSADNGSYIVSYVRDIRTFSSPRHVRTQKFAADGSELWNGGTPINIHSTGSVPIAHTPRLLSDGAGGAVYYWHYAATTVFNCFIQHVAGNGTVLLPAGGVTVSTDAVNNHLDPTAVYFAGSGETCMIWNERNPAQSQWGIYGQRFAADGTTLWGATGKEIVPVNAVNKSLPRSVRFNEDALAFWFDQPVSGVQDRIVGVRLDPNGNSVWPTTPMVVSDTPTDKLRTPITIGPDCVTKLAWEVRDLTNSGEVFAKAVRPSGSVGPVCVGDLNMDDMVDLSDLAGLLSSFGLDAGGDIDYDGDTDLGDLAGLLANFGSNCD
ncbi:MAG: hypothetical protein KDA32_01855 [Phycisphaerales bacterium]|nr:hypothetical protein [Phycisphaerales bacterium]